MISRLVEGYRMFCINCKTEGTPMQEIDNDLKTGLTTTLTFKCFNCNHVIKIVEL